LFDSASRKIDIRKKIQEAEKAIIWKPPQPVAAAQ
jgi:hypothetical protein